MIHQFFPFQICLLLRRLHRCSLTLPSLTSFRSASFRHLNFGGRASRLTARRSPSFTSEERLHQERFVFKIGPKPKSGMTLIDCVSQGRTQNIWPALGHHIHYNVTNVYHNSGNSHSAATNEIINLPGLVPTPRLPLHHHCLVFYLFILARRCFVYLKRLWLLCPNRAPLLLLARVWFHCHNPKHGRSVCGGAKFGEGRRPSLLPGCSTRTSSRPLTPMNLSKPA